MRQWVWVGLLWWSLVSVAEAAGSFTREEIAIMHQAGVKMALEGERKSYVIPADITPERLVQTEVLNFAGNSLVVAPEWLAKFTQVRNLNLANTGIKAEGTLLNALASMRSLEVLDLSGNPLFASGGSLAGVWDQLTGLRHLNLANTAGRASDYGALAALTQLNKLDLSGTSVGGELSELGLKDLPLERLNLAKSGLSDAPLSALPTTTLSELDLSGNGEVTLEEEYGGMFTLPKLVKLSIDDNSTVPEGLRKRLNKLSGTSGGDGIAPRMKEIPAGTFTMGCKNGRDNVEGVDKCEGDETPAHRVSVDSFWLGITEVTFAEWEVCVKDGACPEAKDEGWGRGNRPVINVSWEDTQTYIGWLNKRTGKRYRLPTEAEWEYAARVGRDNTAYPWGNEASHKYANYGKDECCEGLAQGKDQWEHTAPVGQFPANGFGLYDMQGNVWEWVQDWYAEDYYASSPASNPSGASSGSNRVLRGGSWLDTPWLVRSALRGSSTPTNRLRTDGFRLAHGQ